MPPTSVHAAVLMGLATAACQAAPAPRDNAIQIHDSDREWSLTQTATGCRIDGISADPIAITFADGVATSGNDRLAPGPNGLELYQGTTLIARVVDEAGPPRRRSYIDPIGMPIVRLTTIDGAVAAADAARTPLGSVVHSGESGRLSWHDRQGSVGAAIDGTNDLAIGAALLATPTVPVVGRAMIACAGMSESPSPVK